MPLRITGIVSADVDDVVEAAVVLVADVAGDALEVVELGLLPLIFGEGLLA